MTPTSLRSTKPKFLDLFAGCGGLSLGLENAGLELVAAVEKSDMAAETHFRNFHLRGKGWGEEQQKLWEDLKGKSLVEQVRHGTVVGDIWDLLKDSRAMSELKKRSPEVIVGGPPCQGFSMAGSRNPDDKRNQLPWAFLDMVEALDPKAVVIENVAGINMAFSKRGGVEPPFVQLRRALEVAGVEEGGPGYVVQPVEVNARHFGVPQNRPRMMLIALRKDLADAKDITGPEDLSKPWRSQGAFDALPNPKGKTPQARRGRAYMPDLKLVPEVGSLVDRPRNGRRLRREYSAKEGLIDIDVDGYKDLGEDRAKYFQSDHFFARAMRGSRRKNPDPLLNHKERNHSKKVKERFALYHLFATDRFQAHFAETRRDHNLVPNLNALLGLPSRLDDAAARAKIKEVLGDLVDDCPEDLGDNLVDVVMRLDTRKHTQRVVPAHEPAPTVVTLPDDYVHPFEDRIMTVRELARFQSFPDGFEFCSKETTGSHRRKVEVPQYSQVGNAVPPLMAQAIGELLMELLTDD